MMNVADPIGRPCSESMTVHDLLREKMYSKPHSENLSIKLQWTRRDSNPSFRGAPALDPEATFGHHLFFLKTEWTRRDSNPSFRGAPALDPEATFGHHLFFLKTEWTRRDSNPWPSRCKRDDLPLIYEPFKHIRKCALFCSSPYHICLAE